MKVRYLLTGVVVLITAGMLASPGYARIDPGTIVGLWLFDEDNGDEVKDSSGNRHTGVATGGKLKRVEGKFGHALEFSGDGTRVHVEHEDALSLETFTVAVWFKKLASTGVWQTIVIKGNNDSFRNYGIHVQESNFARGIVDEGGVRGAAGASGRVTGKTGFADGQWRHIAITYNKKQFKLYVDGQAETTNQASFAPDKNTSPLAVGAVMDGSRPAISSKKISKPS